MNDIMISSLKLNELRQKTQGLKIFDSSYFLPNTGIVGFDNFKKEHIKDSVFFDIDKISNPNDNLPHMFPSKNVFQNHMQELGLNNDDIVVIYDNSPLFSSARCWFLLKYFGHKKIFILIGGIKEWKKNGFPTSTGEQINKKGNFIAAEDKPDLVIKLDEMEKISNNSLFKILDARSFERFSGKGQEPRPNLESGHIPNSLNLPASKLLNKGNLISNKEFEDIINKLNIKKNEKIIATCGSGVSACVIALAFWKLGNENVILYDGSWSEWAFKGKKIEKSMI